MKRSPIQIIMLHSMIFLAFLSTACVSDPTINEILSSTQEPITRTIPVYKFDWEQSNWMPTPAGQSPIPTPWVGQGSLVGSYDLDIVNDHKASDGWVMLYSTFDPNLSGSLADPYFALYNKYRGLLRIYLYITTPFVNTSTYIQDMIGIAGTETSQVIQKPSLLRFCGKEIVDITDESNPISFQQIQPAPLDGSSPMAANKWYMMQYELAYDPTVENIPYQAIRLYWSLNYIDVQQIALNGEIRGTIEGTIGTSGPSVLNELKSTGKAIGKVALTGIGNKLIEKWTKDKETGANSLNIPADRFKKISESIKNALNSSIADLPKKAISFLSAIIGGSNSPTPISMTLDAKIAMKGDISSHGSFPSSPFSMWMPGTKIHPAATGYLPAYNKPLGLFNITGNPVIKIIINCDTEWEHDTDPEHSDNLIPVDYLSTNISQNEDYSKYLIFNPEIEKIATITVEDQIFVTTGKAYGKEFMHIPAKIYVHTYGGGISNLLFPQDLKYYVRFTIKVAPKDGSPATIIYKTFYFPNEFINSPIPMP